MIPPMINAALITIVVKLFNMFSNVKLFTMLNITGIANTTPIIILVLVILTYFL